VHRQSPCHSDIWTQERVTVLHQKLPCSASAFNSRRPNATSTKYFVAVPTYRRFFQPFLPPYILLLCSAGDSIVLFLSYSPRFSFSLSDSTLRYLDHESDEYIREYFDIGTSITTWTGTAASTKEGSGRPVLYTAPSTAQHPHTASEVSGELQHHVAKSLHKPPTWHTTRIRAILCWRASRAPGPSTAKLKQRQAHNRGGSTGCIDRRRNGRGPSW
jgi:hypothetical protein